jgi:hypothetical protein
MVSHGLLFFACICEVLGYGARLSSHTYPSNVSYHAMCGSSSLVGHEPPPWYLPRSSCMSAVIIPSISADYQATVLILAAMYKAIHRGIKYTPNGSQLSPMRPRSILGGRSSLRGTRVKLIIQSLSLLMSHGVSRPASKRSKLIISPYAARRRVVGRWRYIGRSDW